MFHAMPGGWVRGGDFSGIPCHNSTVAPTSKNQCFVWLVSSQAGPPHGLSTRAEKERSFPLAGSECWQVQAGVKGCSLPRQGGADPERGQQDGDAMAGRVQQGCLSIAQLLSLVRTEGVRTEETKEEIPLGHGQLEEKEGDRNGS
jgi:hypothetical protein